MDHLPKGDLKKIDELAETLMWIQGLSKEKKLIIDNKLKLIGTDIKRSLAELLEGPENFLRTEIPLPDKESPESIKTFLYKMQGQGRQGRDALNIAPGRISSLFNQHHIAGLMELFPNYAGKKAREAWDISKNIYETTGVRPGTNGGNVVEIAGDRLVHLVQGHGGSFSAPKIFGTAEEMLTKTFGAIKLNLQRAGRAQEATLPLSNYVNKNMSDGGIILADDPFFDTEITPEKAKNYRAAVTKGLKLNNNGVIPSNTDILIKSGMSDQLARLAGKAVKPIGALLDAGSALAGTTGALDENKTGLEKTASALDATSGALGLGSLAAPALGPLSVGAGIFAAGDQTAPDIANAVAPYVPTPTLYSNENSTGDVGRDAGIAISNAAESVKDFVTQDFGITELAERTTKRGIEWIRGIPRFAITY